jgi:hypothetical protein
MKFINFQNKPYYKDIKFYKYKKKSIEKCRSKFQYNIGNALQEIYPMYEICEEFPIGERLKIDFIIPRLKIAVECMGDQHYKFNKYFQGTINGFKQQKINDEKKRKWIELNNYKLIKIKWPECDKNKILEIIKEAF